MEIEVRVKRRIREIIYKIEIDPSEVMGSTMSVEDLFRFKMENITNEIIAVGLGGKS